VHPATGLPTGQVMSEAPGLIRKAKTRLAELLVEAGTLPESPSGFARMKAISQEAQEAGRWLWPRESKKANAELNARRSRVATATYAKEVHRILESAQGYEGALVLKNSLSSLGDLSAEVDPETKRRAEADISQALERILKPLLTEQSTALLETKPGCRGLDEGAKWYQGFDAKFIHAFESEETRTIQGQFWGQRRKQIEASRPEMEAMIAGSRTPEEVAGVLGKCLALEDDRWEPTAQKMRKAAQERI